MTTHDRQVTKSLSQLNDGSQMKDGCGGEQAHVNHHRGYSLSNSRSKPLRLHLKPDPLDTENKMWLL